ncbi:uncharacterized protein PpBr36_10207, partial [Pyricularia pennisetigena]|uniref:uncharacterized protein n=1 Tax=Pyricularia pennisetigena TaxID=1578925 RepID=UPI001152A639
YSPRATTTPVGLATVIDDAELDLARRPAPDLFPKEEEHHDAQADHDERLAVDGKRRHGALRLHPGGGLAGHEEGDDDAHAADVDQHRARPHGVALDGEDVGQRQRRQVPKDDEERPRQRDGPVQVLLRRRPEQERPRDARHERQHKVGQVVLRLSEVLGRRRDPTRDHAVFAIGALPRHVPGLPPRRGEAELVGHRPGEHVDEDGRDDKRREREARVLVPPALRQQRKRRDLLRGLRRDDEGAVRKRRPQHHGEERRPQRVEHADPRLAPLEPAVEDADLGPDGARRVVEVVDLRTGLADWTETSDLPRAFLHLVNRVSGMKNSNSTQAKMPKPDVIQRGDAHRDDEEALRRHDDRHPRVALVQEEHVLDDERDQGLDRAGPEPLQRPGGQVRVEAGAHGRPEAADPGARRREQEDRPPPDGDAQRHEEVGRDAVGQERDRHQQRYAAQVRRSDALGEDRQGASGRAAAPVREVDLVNVVRVHARVLQDEYRDQAADDHFGCQRESADFCTTCTFPVKEDKSCTYRDQPNAAIGAVESRPRDLQERNRGSTDIVLMLQERTYFIPNTSCIASGGRR